MHLSSLEFNAFLNDMAQNFSWKRAYACPCVSPMTGGAEPNCPHCFGKGRTWDATATLGLAAIVGRNNLKKFGDFGLFDVSDTMLSIPSDSPLWAIGEYDRVIALNRSEPFSINLVSGINDVIRKPVAEITRVSWINSVGAMVEGSIPTVLSNGLLQWSGLTPPEQTTYSVTGRAIPEYFVYMDLPFDRPHHAGEPLPRRVVLRRFDLFGR